MARFTTIVSVVARHSTELVAAAAAEAANVSAVLLDAVSARDEAQRRPAAWSEAARRRNVYTLVDFDPQIPVVDAWVARLQGEPYAMDAAAGLIEVEDMAEYVLVADDTAGDEVHWYHGLLHSFAPHRVVPIQPRPAAILAALANLKPGPSFPHPQVIMRAALEYVPTGLSAETTAQNAETVPGPEPRQM